MKVDTKIICTIGPSSKKEEMLVKMASRGMDTVRLNFSHGSHSEHKKVINTINKINKTNNLRIKILQDLEGYRIRVGHFKKEKLLEKDQIVYMSSEFSKAKNHIPFDYIDGVKKIPKDADVFIDDASLHLKVIGYRKKQLKLKVIVGGVLNQRKGINIPKLKLSANIMTDKDKADLEFGINNKVDFVAQSFVRNKKDILRVADIVKPKLPQCKIISKIESQEGLRNLDSIIDSCDGIMIARGDLGVSLPIYKIPMAQKFIIHRCNRKKKFVITATQMLETMIEHGRPTRAEVSDIANAILDGTDYVMLSGETAVGKYPSRCVKTMQDIIEYTEKYEHNMF